MDEALTSMAAGLNGKDKHTAATVAEWWGGAKGGLTWTWCSDFLAVGQLIEFRAETEIRNSCLPFPDFASVSGVQVTWMVHVYTRTQ